LQHGVYTFEYSTTGLSKNVQAKLKRIQFAKKNIPQNIQAFAKTFTPQAVGEIVAADTVSDIYNLIHDVQSDYGEFVNVMLLFDGHPNP